MLAFLNLSVLADLVAMAALALHYAAGKEDNQAFLQDAAAEFKQLTADLPTIGWVTRFLASEQKVQRLLSFVLILLGGVDQLKAQLSAVTAPAITTNTGPGATVSIPSAS